MCVCVFGRVGGMDFLSLAVQAWTCAVFSLDQTQEVDCALLIVCELVGAVVGLFPLLASPRTVQEGEEEAGSDLLLVRVFLSAEHPHQAKLGLTNLEARKAWVLERYRWRRK